MIDATIGHLERNTSLPVHADNIRCVGTEKKLSECDYTRVNSCLDSSKDVALKCQKSEYYLSYRLYDIYVYTYANQIDCIYMHIQNLAKTETSV